MWKHCLLSEQLKIRDEEKDSMKFFGSRMALGISQSCPFPAELLRF